MYIVAVQRIHPELCSRHLFNLLASGGFKFVGNPLLRVHFGKSIRETLHVSERVFVETTSILSRSPGILQPNPQFQKVPRVPRRSRNRFLLHRFEEITAYSVHRSKGSW